MKFDEIYFIIIKNSVQFEKLKIHKKMFGGNIINFKIIKAEYFFLNCLKLYRVPGVSCFPNTLYTV